MQVTIDIPDKILAEIAASGYNLASFVLSPVTGQQRRPSTQEEKEQAVRNIEALAERVANRPGPPLPSIRSMIDEGRRY